MILGYIVDQIEKSNIFESYKIRTDELREYAQSLMISAIPGIPIQAQYTHGEKEVILNFLLTWRTKAITEPQRLYSNEMFERLSDWMDTQNTKTAYLQSISDDKYVIAWRVLDGGMADEKDEKGNEVYAIQCALIYHQSGYLTR